MGKSSEEIARRFARDPIILGGCFLSAFGIIGIVDNFFAWRDYFINFLKYWDQIKEIIFKFIPIYLSEPVKDLAIQYIFIGATLFRAFKLSPPGNERKIFSIIYLVGGVCLFLFSLVFIESSPPWDREATRRALNVPGVEGVIASWDAGYRDANSLTGYLFSFLGASGVAVYFLTSSNSNVAMRQTASAFLFSLLTTFAIAAVIILICVKW